MKILLKLAWRNVLRNKRRTLLSGLAVGIGLASMIFVNAVFSGMLQSMIRTATDTFIGQGQIHAKGFRDTLEVEKTIENPGSVIKQLGRENMLACFTPRTVSFSMLSSAGGVKSVMLYGIKPGSEMKISILDESITNGRYLDNDNRGMILIGSKTAETLNVEVGDRLVVTVAQAYSGELSQEMFRVGGIFRMGIREADSGLAFINIKKAQELLGIGNNIHEIALRFKDIEMAGDPALPFWRKYSRNGNEAISWKTMVPQLDSVIEMSHISTGITLLLVFGIIGLTIMNSLFMSLYERMFEFGVLRAIGTRPVSMAIIILLEASILAVISILAGSLLGYAVTKYFSVNGINYKGIEFAGLTITKFIYPVFSPEQFTLYPLLIIIFSLTAAIYPAVFAARLTPARAMRRSI
ncbi:lipoprotein-releasing system transmembrane protein LolE [bacterium BMS3Abin07]|nr:lipoprotein-releasing system transmembrane protein LolE [bacterium BMS3Abin07]GBE32702.1 lipoprotein-releasing system transmembrane protein LolE [bacterium BMS3Bbin05]HDL19639.1 ABC transporter permease [Nitrospirota bacterium]HDO22072.1 ABC transporter permease [Nitrospirota bacterium]HDZ88930.1 ABC transporter permease [Nitrospirota bacterium]